MQTQTNPWRAMVALLVGFFMILLDMTIVAVANPKIMIGLNTDVTKVIWVTSAYLLTYAVPLLITGRLGDRFGPKNLYLAGLVVFTASSLWCGLSSGIGGLIAARAVQGLGAALMAPQTMAIITRIFPAERRGAAMGLWGGVGGLATLVGPILGGVLTDHFGWQWIFYINVPLGVAGFALAMWLVPALPTHRHRFDWVGVALSAVGMTALVFGIQEGNTYDWAGWVWGLIVGGLAVLGLFVLWQARNTGEPLVPLALFKERNFSLSNLAISSVGAAITAMMLPVFFYLQAIKGFDATSSGLMMAPMAIVTAVLSPFVGRMADSLPPRVIPAFGIAAMSGSMLWTLAVMTPESKTWQLVLPFLLAGVGSACIWAPLASVATRGLPLQQAGAGSGVYNTTRQVGSVLGSAGISALMTARGRADIPHFAGKFSEGGGNGHLPAVLMHPFSNALAESMYLPAGVLLIGVLAALGFTRVRPATAAPAAQPRTEAAA